MRGVSPPQAALQFSTDTVLASNSLTQSGPTYLEVASAHRCGAQAHQTASVSEASYQSQGAACDSDGPTPTRRVPQHPPKVQQYASVSHRTQESS